MDYDMQPMTVFTAYSYDEMKGFLRVQYRRILRIGVFGLLFVLGSMALNVFILSADRGFNWSFVYRLGVAGMIMLLIPLLLIGMGLGLFYTQKQHQKATKLLPNGQTCSFRNYAFDSVNDSYLNTGRSTFRYEGLHSVLETRDMFYLYTAPSTAILVSKNGFRAGSPEELRMVLRYHLPPKKCKFYAKGQ